MRLAVLSDVHANATALRAVLDDLPAVDPLILLGDIASDGAQPHETIALIRERATITVMGNMDAFLLNPTRQRVQSERERRLHEIARWSAEQLTGDERDYLRQFSAVVQVMIGDIQVLCYHGSPQHNETLILPETPYQDLTRAFAGYEEAKLLIGGHSHQQMLRRWGERTLINPGSVGLANHRYSDGSLRPAPYAEYALISIEGTAQNISLRRVPYDIEAYHAALRQSGMPHVDWLLEQWA